MVTDKVAMRRIRLDVAGWVTVHAAAVAAGLDMSSLPAPSPTTDEAQERVEVLVDKGVLERDGSLAGWVRAGLGMVTAGPVTVEASRQSSSRKTWGRWATLGVPTAGLVVEVFTDLGTVEVEIQLMTIDDLVGAVLDVVAIPATAHPDGATPVEVSAVTPPQRLTGRVARVWEDGEAAVAAQVDVAGPAGAMAIVLVADGQLWLTGDTTAPGMVRWSPIDGQAVR